MQTRFITTEQELVAIKGDWDRLVLSRPETDMPFYSWDWFYLSWLHFGKPDGLELLIVTVYESERLVGILPLLREKRKYGGMKYRTLCFCNTGVTPRNTLFTDSFQDQETVFCAAWNHLLEHHSAWDMLEFANVLSESLFHRFILEGPLRKKYAILQTQGRISPFVELTGTLEEYINTSLSRETRKNVRRRVKRFNVAGYSRSIRFFEKPDDIDEGLKFLETVHHNSWKGPYKNLHYPLFYQEVTPILAQRGEVKITVAFLDDVPISGGYVLSKNGSYYGYISDYDQQYHEYSPGTVLLHSQWEHLLKEKGRIFDFCGMDYAYKKQFATGYQNHSNFEIFHSGIKSRMIYLAKKRWLPLLRKLRNAFQKQRESSTENEDRD